MRYFRPSNLISTLLVFLIIIFNSIYVLNEGYQAILISLGQTKDAEKNHVITQPGLHFKWPIIEHVQKLDMRSKGLSGTSSVLTTVDQQSLNVNYYLAWRVSTIPAYIAAAQGKSEQVSVSLQTEVNKALQVLIQKNTLQQLLVMQVTHNQVLQSTALKAAVAQLGVSVVDLRIKGFVFADETATAIYNNMRADFQQTAAQYLAQGKSSAEVIRAEADKKVMLGLADAKLKAATIRAEGDKQAATVYSEAYNKDPEFYAFYKSLGVYKKSFSQQENAVVIKPDGEFFKFIKSSGQQKHTSSK